MVVRSARVRSGGAWRNVLGDISKGGVGVGLARKGLLGSEVVGDERGGSEGKRSEKRKGKRTDLVHNLYGDVERKALL